MDLLKAKILDESETLFSNALIAIDFNTLQSLSHPNATFTTESAETFEGIINLHENYTAIIKLVSIERLERKVQFHGNIAVVNSIERRVGLLNFINIESQYSITRIWKCLPKKCIVLSGCIVNQRSTSIQH